MPVITPEPSNGLVQRSAAMCGRVSCIRKARLDQQIGSVHAQQLRRVRLEVAARRLSGKLSLLGCRPGRLHQR